MQVTRSNSEINNLVESQAKRIKTKQQKTPTSTHVVHNLYLIKEENKKLAIWLEEKKCNE